MLLARCARITRPLKASLRAALSTQRIELQHGGYLDVLLSNARKATINVVTTWEDHVEIETADDKYLDVWVDNQRLQIVDKHDAKEVSFTAKIPQRFNCLIRAKDTLDLNVGRKLEGDLVFSCQDGTVNLDKIRGMIVHGSCTNGTINVTDSVEGEVSFTAANVNAKLLNGTAVHVEAEERAEVLACYSPSAVVVSKTSDVKISTSHGAMLVQAKGSADVQGVNGSFNIECDGDLTVDVRKLASGTNSKAVSHKGNIVITFDPTITPDQVTITGYDAMGFLLPVVFENKPEDSSHLGDISTARSSGKIALAEADTQALDQFVKSPYVSDTNAVGSKANAKKEKPQIPTVKLRGKNIKCRYASWKDAIKSKYGFA